MMKKGLMSSFDKGKKTFFQVENPKQLLRLLKEQENDLKKKKKVAISSLKSKLVGMIIENKSITKTFKSLFYLAWEAAKKYQKDYD